MPPRCCTQPISFSTARTARLLLGVDTGRYRARLTLLGFAGSHAEGEMGKPVPTRREDPFHSSKPRWYSDQVNPGQRWLSWVCVVFALTLATRVSSAAASGPTVQTTEGPVRGEANGQAAMFRGIPFAAPPVGSLRWRAPQTPAARGSTLDASSFATPCPQWVDATLTGSEDCLYLNVWAPLQPVGQGWPVMLFIDGGGNTARFCGADDSQRPRLRRPLA